jgi:hypothetical protein
LKSLAVEGTVFWSVASAFVELGAIIGSSAHVVEGSVAVVLDLLVAYLCWRERMLGFVLAVMLGLFVAIVAFPFLLGGEQTPFGALVDALVILSALLTVFFGYRAFTEARAVKT